MDCVFRFLLFFPHVICLSLSATFSPRLYASSLKIFSLDKSILFFFWQLKPFRTVSSLGLHCVFSSLVGMSLTIIIEYLSIRTDHTLQKFSNIPTLLSWTCSDKKKYGSLFWGLNKQHFGTNFQTKVSFEKTLQNSTCPLYFNIFTPVFYIQIVTNLEVWDIQVLTLHFSKEELRQ